MNRKASDVIIELENKITKLLQQFEQTAFTQKLILNKLNELTKVQTTVPVAKSPAIFVEAADVKQPQLRAEPTKPETISVSDNNVQVDNAPVGHRRTSRHENYTGGKSKVNDDGFSSQIQVPQGKGSQVINKAVEVAPPLDAPAKTESVGNIPVMQRIVDENGKSVFMADVQVLTVPGLDRQIKVRTGGTGKWSGTLPTGKYRAIIKRRDKLTKNELQTTFDFVVNGDSSPLELETLIFNSK